MKILIAPDSFKDALPSLAVCQAIGRGVRRAMPIAETTLFPMADGGEGTADVLAWHLKGRPVDVQVHDPLFRPIAAQYLLSENGQTAFIEMAAASGLQLLASSERNPLLTTTFGTGELILDAYNKGVTKILLGIGGSATNDAGMGMAAALGWRFLSENGEELQPVGGNLGMVGEVLRPTSLTTTPPASAGGVVVEVICDVDNPLFGRNGAAHVYARQKGADDAAIAELDEGLRHFSGVLAQCFGQDFSDMPGAGAAGGMGAGAAAFLNAKLRRGVDLMMELTGFEEVLKNADLVLTGEGKLDGQTAHGKLIHGICRMAQKHGIPVVAFCGTLEASPADLEAMGLLAAFSILEKPQTLAAALEGTENGLENLAYNVLKIMGFQNKFVPKINF